MLRCSVLYKTLARDQVRTYIVSFATTTVTRANSSYVDLARSTCTYQIYVLVNIDIAIHQASEPASQQSASQPHQVSDLLGGCLAGLAERSDVVGYSFAIWADVGKPARVETNSA